MRENTPINLRWLVPFLLAALLIAYLENAGEALKIPGAAKLGGISLQIAAEPKEALVILRSWSEHQSEADLIALARSQIYWDFLLISLYAYGLFWAFRASAFLFEPPKDDLVRKFAKTPLYAALLDAVVENTGMLWMLLTPDREPSPWISVGVAVASWFKWGVLLLTFVFLLIVVVIRVFRSESPALADGDEVDAPSRVASPARVLHFELQHISRDRAEPIAPAPEDGNLDDERSAWRRAHASNLVGLALSGGGIRSATFSLGVLQAFAKRGLLSRLDYLSTVSGGGYVGSWLSAWCRRKKGIAEVEKELSDTNSFPAPVIFLRSYSNYLTPRTGVFGVDTWTAIATWFRNFLVNTLILLAFVWCALAALMLFVKTIGGSGIVGGVFAALLLFVAIAAVTFGVTLDVDRNTAFWGRFVSGRAVKYGVIGPLLLACVSGGVWWIVWANGDWRRAIEPIIWVACIGSVVWIVSLIYSLAANRKLRKSTAVHRQTINWETAALYVAAVVLGISMLAATVWVGTAPMHKIGEELLGIVDTEQFNGTYVRAFLLSPPLLLVGTLVGVYAAIFLLGATYSDKGREWWARLGGSFSLALVFWFLIVVFSFAIPGMVQWLGASQGERTNLAYVLSAVWAAVTALTALVARSAVGKNSIGSAKALVIRFGPYIAAVGFFVVAAYWFFVFVTAVFGIDPAWPEGDEGLQAYIGAGVRALMDPNRTRYFWAAAGCGVVAMIFALRADINLFSLRDFYKNRLVRAYLGATNPGRPGNADDFTGFSKSDDLYLHEMRKVVRPYQLINAALNIVHGRRLAWQERKAASFLFSPLYCGYSLPQLETGDEDKNYRSTLTYADNGKNGEGITLGEAMALSGAALSPNRGQNSTPILTLLMTLLNVRLGGWLPNPRFDERRRSPMIAGEYLFQELFGLTSEETRYVNVSDGGHFDNLGVYELVRRRCRVIIVSDASEDTSRVFDDLGSCIRKCLLDFNVRIHLDVTKLIPNADRISESSWAAGRVEYPSFGGAPMEGVILYLKASIIERVRHNASLLSYFRMQGAFPHHSTVDQWFGESIFESYRALGEQLAEALCANNKKVLGLA